MQSQSLIFVEHLLGRNTFAFVFLTEFLFEFIYILLLEVLIKPSRDCLFGIEGVSLYAFHTFKYTWYVSVFTIHSLYQFESLCPLRNMQ